MTSAWGPKVLHHLIVAVDQPNCRALFDAWAPALQGEGLRVRSDLVFGGLTAHTTVADYQLRPRYKYQPNLVNYEKQTPYAQAVPMGEGFDRLSSVFQVPFAPAGFNGSIAYEMCSPLLHGGDLATLDAQLLYFLEYVRREDL